jgi:hypothetical protein
LINSVDGAAAQSGWNAGQVAHPPSAHQIDHARGARCRFAPALQSPWIRKAILGRLAERGGTSKQLQAVSGHRSLAELERYTEMAEQARLNRTGGQ